MLLFSAFMLIEIAARKDQRYWVPSGGAGIRIVDRPIELLGLFAILAGRTERRERAPLKPVPATAVERFAFRPQSGEVSPTDSSR
jgi:hypothetical protein